MRSTPKPLVLITHPLFPEIVRSKLGRKFRWRLVRSRRELEARIPRAHALVTLVKDPVDDALLARAPELRVVGNFAVGLDNVDLHACARRGIRVVNTPRVLTRATAELAATLLLAAARRLPEGEALCRRGKFKGWEPDLLLGLELRGRQAVIVGPGRIGRETARLFQALGLQTRFIGPKTRAARERQLLKSAQVLSIHTPLTPATRHWLNARRLSILPKEAIVINTSRGPVVDERALISALKRRRIFAAGLDVFEGEPHIPRALRQLSNVILLPHVGSATREARIAMAETVLDGIVAILNGKHPWNEVNLPGYAKQPRSANHSRL
jgi:glyoxylate reductase